MVIDSNETRRDADAGINVQQTYIHHSITNVFWNKSAVSQITSSWESGKQIMGCARKEML